MKYAVNHGFLQKEKTGVCYLQIPAFLEEGFDKHLFTSRIGGVSGGCYNSLNLSLTRESSVENKKMNYKRVCEVLDVPYESLTVVNYAHGDGVYEARVEDAGKGISRPSDLPPCDAMFVSEPNVTAVSLHADCVPIFFADRKNRIAGVCHAGWRGVYADIVAKIANLLGSKKQCLKSDLLFGIGPHITVKNFEVGEDVASLFVKRFGCEYVDRRDNRLYISLQNVLTDRLIALGIPAENITCSDLCTFGNEDLFYSHRRDHGNTGAMGSFFALAE